MLGLAQTDRVNNLTDGQRDCLRLVAENRSSKEIARMLGISPHTVDQRLKRATAILAVESRFEAARTFMSQARRSAASPLVCDALVYQHPELFSRDEYRDFGAPLDEQDPPGGGDGATLHEAQASYFSMFEPQGKPRTLASVLGDIGGENELPVSWRLIVILAIMLLGIVSFALLVNVVEGVSRLY